MESSDIEQDINYQVGNLLFNNYSYDDAVKAYKQCDIVNSPKLITNLIKCLLKLGDIKEV